MIVKFSLIPIKELKEKFNLSDKEIEKIAKAQGYKNYNDNTKIICTIKDDRIYVLQAPTKISELKLKMKIKNLEYRDISLLQRLIFETEEAKNQDKIVFLKIKDLFNSSKLHKYIENLSLIGYRDGEVFLCIRDSLTGDPIYKMKLNLFLEENYDRYVLVEKLEGDDDENITRIYKLYSDRNTITDVKLKEKRPVNVNVKAFGKELSYLYEGVIHIKALIFGTPMETEFAIRSEKVRDYLMNYEYKATSYYIRIDGNLPGYTETDYDRKYIPFLSKTYKELLKENNKFVSEFIKGIEPDLRRLTRETIMNLKEKLPAFKNTIRKLTESLDNILYNEGLTTVYGSSEVEQIIKNEIENVLLNSNLKALRKIVEELPDDIFTCNRMTKDDFVKIVKILNETDIPKVLRDHIDWIINNTIESIYSYLTKSA